MLRRVGDGHPRFLRQRINVARSLRQDIEQLQTLIARERLRHPREMGVDFVLKFPLAHLGKCIEALADLSTTQLST